MAAQFDPYYKWLGILPAEQPPSYYRLLGIASFESDPDVIDAAADQRMTFLRNCAGGMHVADSQRLLSEVAAARLCLLASEKKSVYDAKLKQSLPVAKQVEATPGSQWWQGRNTWIVSGGGALILLLGVIIIRFTDKDGSVTEIKAPGDAKVAITAPRIQNPESKIQNPIWHGWPADAPAPAITPFDAAQAKKHQAAWAKHLKLDVEYTNSLGMKFVLIPPGEFMMGSMPAEIEAALKDVGEYKHWQECIRSEAPKHEVVLTQPIYLGVNEVTQAEYEKVMGTNPSHFSPLGQGKDQVAGMDTSSHPVEQVSWYDAAEFCAKLSQLENLKPFYFRAGETVMPLEGTGYRLPAEAEWEFACRVGTATKYWTGDNYEDLTRAGWFSTYAGGRTHVVGELNANPFGLYDVHGNVSEWVEDWWKPEFSGESQEKPTVDPTGPSSAGSRRVIRGGNWGNNASLCRSSSRLALDPSYRDATIGFRLSRVAGSPRVGR